MVLFSCVPVVSVVAGREFARDLAEVVGGSLVALSLGPAREGFEAREGVGGVGGRVVGCHGGSPCLARAGRAGGGAALVSRPVQQNYHGKQAGASPLVQPGVHGFVSVASVQQGRCAPGFPSTGVLAGTCCAAAKWRAEALLRGVTANGEEARALFHVKRRRSARAEGRGTGHERKQGVGRSGTRLRASNIWGYVLLCPRAPASHRSRIPCACPPRVVLWCQRRYHYLSHVWGG